MARFMVLARDSAPSTHMSPEENQKMIERYRSWSDRLRQAGKVLEGQKLWQGEGKTVRKKGTSLTVTDGPYAESKEILGGFWLIEASSYDEALALVGDSPHLEYGGTLEVRRIEEMPHRQ